MARSDALKPPPVGDLTLREWVDYLAPGIWEEGKAPGWPPDIFAISASILHKSGAYVRVLEEWPPEEGWPKRRGRRHSLDEWVHAIRRIGKSWRDAVEEIRAHDFEAELVSSQDDVQRWWGQLLEAGDLPLSRLATSGARAGAKQRPVCHALLNLLAAADEACEGIGVPGTTGAFAGYATHLLRSTSEAEGGATLCLRISKSRLRVLPKIHAPQSGLTIRSLSHHLTVCPAGDVEPNWFPVMTRLEAAGSTNILLIPWPLEVAPSHFSAVGSPSLSTGHGLFAYNPPRADREPAILTERLMESAEKQVGRIDGVIFPELALTERQLERVCRRVLQKDAFLVAGARAGAGKRGGPGRNYWASYLPFLDDFVVEIKQDKHHRWRLDRRQIVQYGLGGRLHPNTFWWEHIAMNRREIWFLGLRRWLTVCVLICEDLARQEPVAEVVRAVGPNLVLALLMDGPQLGARWPGRYATVLAEDPGCSVLTLTSLGMSRLSRTEDGRHGSRTVALWKDDKYGASIPIDLPDGAHGIVLSLAEESKSEWTADGRKKDERLAVYPTLNGIYYVRADEPRKGSSPRRQNAPSPTR